MRSARLTAGLFSAVSLLPIQYPEARRAEGSLLYRSSIPSFHSADSETTTPPIDHLSAARLLLRYSEPGFKLSVSRAVHDSKMRFDIETDPVRIANIQAELAHRHDQMMKSRGAVLRYETPPLPNAFPQLSRILEGSPHQAKFLDTYYHIESEDGRIERLIPAAEYYKFVFRAVAGKRYALELGLGRIRDLERWIQRYYHEIRDPMLSGTQPSYRVVDQVYALKSELGNILFVARGALDTIATLFHFLYGSSSRQFTDFAAFMQYLDEGHAGGTEPDPAMREYIAQQLGWFRTLHEYRDYVTHFGSIDITFYEPQEGVVRTYLQDALEVHEVVAPVLSGLDSFCEFVDGHFAARITAASLQSVS